MLDDHGLTDYAEVRRAPLVDVELEDESLPWYDPSQLPTQPIDLLFVDGPPKPRMPKPATQLSPCRNRT